jgi:hypothetical protein
LRTKKFYPGREKMNFATGCLLAPIAAPQVQQQMGKLMNMVAMRIAMVVFATAVLPISAQAAGCLKGAAAGGVVGHVAGHHGLAGAGIGCAVGHHDATKKASRTGTAGEGSSGSSGQTHHY